MAHGTLVDSNVLLDILTQDPTWQDWSTDALAGAAEAGPLYINPIVYSEVSPGSRSGTDPMSRHSDVTDRSAAIASVSEAQQKFARLGGPCHPH